MKVITGIDINTTTGRMVVLDDIDEKIAVGDNVLFDGEEYTILSLVPSSKPNGKWSVRIQ